MPTTEERVDALEAAQHEIRLELMNQTAVITQAGATQLAAIHTEGQRVTTELLAVNAAVVKISQGLLTLQAQVTKWAAAGSLAGAVILFIAVRALGF